MSSLKLSLVLGAALWSILTLSAAGAAITFIFSITVQRDQMEDLGAALDRLTTELLQDQPVIERALNDPRYEVPGGGLYYQVQEVESSEVLRSRSLWDSELDLPVPPAGGEALVERTGPEGQVLTTLVRDVEIVPNSGERRMVRIAVAENVDLRGGSIRSFAAQIGVALLIVAVGLSIAGWFLVHLGLRPVDKLRRGLEQITSGNRSRLDETVPVEFVPLVHEVNSLLDVQERTIKLSRERADDLAHGLKTPLAVMRATAERLKAAGDEFNASGLELLSAEMAERIDYQLRLTQLRIRSESQGLSSSVDQALIRSVAVIRKTGRGADLFWNMSADRVSADIDSHDLMELVGVLLENACKWARSEVVVSCALAEGQAQFAVADDGPGLGEDEIAQLGVRGHRLDETRSGTGFGIAIAKEIVRLNRGSIMLDRAPAGGLRVKVELPATSRRADNSLT